MAKQITLKNLQDVAQRTKQYIDDKGGAMVYRTETTLYTNTTGQTGNITVTLSQPFTNFDAIIVYVGTGTELKGRTTNVEISSADLLDGRNINFYPAYDAVAYATVNVGRYSTTDNTLWATIVRSNGWTSQNIAVGVSKIVGINYVPMENYSTTEQVIGTWIDGRPVYQKTINFGQLPDTSIKTVSTGLDSSTRMIEAYGMAYRPSDGANFPIPLVAEMDNLTAQMPLYFRLNSNNIYDAYIHTSIDRTAFTECYITIKYTKASS